MNIKLYLAGAVIVTVITAGLIHTSHADKSQAGKANCHIEGGGVLVCEDANCHVGQGGAYVCDDESKKGDNTTHCRVGEGGAMECDNEPKKGNCHVEAGGAYVCDDEPKQKAKGNK